MKELKVLYITPYPHGNRTTGGNEAVAQALASTLALQPEIEAVQVIAFPRNIGEYQRVVLNAKLTVHYVPGQRRFGLPTGMVLNVLWARRYARQFRPDIVHGQTIGVSGEVATRLGFPAVVTATGLVHVEARLSGEHPVRIWLLDRRVRRVLRRAKVVISTSDYDRRMLRSLVRNHHISVPNPVSSTFFDYQTEPDSNRILFAGTMVPRKNVLGIVRAFALVKAQMPDARLDLVGPSIDANYAARVRQLVSELNLTKEVISHGFVEDGQLLGLMGQCAVLVLFSSEETSPTVIAQAMAMGKPVVASRVGGIPEMVRDGESGFVVEVGDESALASRAVQLLRSPALRHSMGLQARNIAQERFDPSVVAKQTIDVYRMLIK